MVVQKHAFRMVEDSRYMGDGDECFEIPLRNQMRFVHEAIH